MTAFSATRLFDLIERLVFCHSPSGAEEEIDAFIKARLDELGLAHEQDAAGNIIACLRGQDPARTLAITAHKDEIAAIVKDIDAQGRVRARKLGGAYPWVYGEGVVDLLGDQHLVSGILSFGARHVSHESPQKCHQEDKALKWEDVWVETKLTPAQLQAAGIRPGTRMVVGKHRKAPFRLGEYLASYTLDNKASVAVLLGLAEGLRQPACNLLLAFTAREEVGAMGALYLTRQRQVDELIALEICPKSSEYPIASDRAPVLVSQDGYGLYDENLNRALAAAARAAGVELQHVLLNSFGSDASIAMKHGHVAKAACLGFPADNTHGYEIAHADAILGCLKVLEAYCA
jgi:putative aminopeptidase FrvX